MLRYCKISVHQITKGVIVRAKSSNKINILLTAITLLLLFVIGVIDLGKTNSWLVDSDTIGFHVQVGTMDLFLRQGGREITNGGYVYLSTEIIEADTPYLTNTLTTVNNVTTGTDNSVIMVNEERGQGYYIRFQAIAMINGVAYNINDYITGSDFVNRKDADSNAWWMYSVDNKSATTPANAPIAGETSLTLIKDLIFPQSFINTVQGQYFKLYLFIEGSGNGEFI